jgi:hypothetical protein
VGVHSVEKLNLSCKIEETTIRYHGVDRTLEYRSRRRLG